AGFPNTYDDSASFSTNLFQPAIDVTKTGDALSKIGDKVNYTITVFNNSSADTPTRSDERRVGKQGSTQQNAGLANDATYGINVNDVVVATNARAPIGNPVTVHATVAGFPNTYDDSASFSTNLFQPAIDVTKTGDALSKIGDKVNYTITVFNNSSADTPT